MSRRIKNVTINVEAIPHDQYKVKVRAAGAGKQLPDLFVVWPGAELSRWRMEKS